MLRANAMAFVLGVPCVWANDAPCPQQMSQAVEAKLLPVLVAIDQANRINSVSTSEGLARTADAAVDALIDAKDDASAEARVALMDYPIGAAYSEVLSCAVSIGGKKALHLLRLYSRCDIAPSRSPLPRDHSINLRSLTLRQWKAGGGKGSCEYE